MSTILCIETATYNGSIALLSFGESQVVNLNPELKHIETLALEVASLLASIGKSAKEIDAVAISIGPGSYTGLRIGLSFAKGLAHGLKIPIMAIPTLDILAAASFKKYPTTDCAIPLLDARRMEVYTAIYKEKESSPRPIAHVVDEDSFAEHKNRKVIFAGDGTQKVADLLSNELWIFDLDIKLCARDMIPLALKRLEKKEFNDLFELQPFYLKEFAVGKPSQKLKNFLMS